MSLFEDFLNLELPRRPVHLTVTITGFDGDPNDIGAPAIISGAPDGTWYLRETPTQLWFRKKASAYVIADTTEISVDGGAFTDGAPVSQRFVDGGSF